MTEAPVAFVSASDVPVPDLDLPAPRPARVAPVSTFDDPESDASPLAPGPPFELDRTRTSCAQSRFVTGAASRFEPTLVDCPYCGTQRFAYRVECASCGYRASTLLPVPDHASPPALLISAPQSGLDRCIEALTFIPVGFWKRVPVYAFLAMVLGNGCRCGGLSAHTNLALVVLILVGLAGLAASLQRSP